MIAAAIATDATANGGSPAAAAMFGQLFNCRLADWLPLVSHGFVGSFFHFSKIVARYLRDTCEALARRF